MHNFVIIGPNTENTEDLLLEIKKRGHAALVVKLMDVMFEFSSGQFRAFWKGRDLLCDDIFIFRGYNKNLLFAEILAEQLIENGKVVIDEAIGKRFAHSKVYEAAMMNRIGISHPKTYQAVNSSTYSAHADEVSFPIIAKPIDGQKGQGIEKIMSKEQYLSFFAKNPKGYLFQEYLKITYDIRVLVVAGQALGAMKRHIIPGDFRSNASLGARTEKIELTDDLRSLAVRAAKVMDYEVAGVDIIKDGGRLYVLEINSSPQWQKFKEVTGINPAESIVDYALIKQKEIGQKSSGATP